MEVYTITSPLTLLLTPAAAGAAAFLSPPPPQPVISTAAKAIAAAAAVNILVCFIDKYSPLRFIFYTEIKGGDPVRRSPPTPDRTYLSITRTRNASLI